MNEKFIQAISSLQAKHPKVRLVLPYVGPMETIAVRWLEPDPDLKSKFEELDDVKEELASYIPIGRVGDECLLVDSRAPHSVAVFMEQLWPLAPSLTEFFKSVVLKPGDKTPMQRLEATRKQGLKLEKAKRPLEAIALLEPELVPYRQDPDPQRDTTGDHEELVADAWNSLGVFYESARDLPRARQAFQHAGAWGATLGILNYCGTCKTVSDVEPAVSVLASFLAVNEPTLGREDAIKLRAILVAWQLRTGSVAEAEKTAVNWLSRCGKAVRKLLWPQQREALLQTLKDQGVTDYDTARFNTLAKPHL